MKYDEQITVAKVDQEMLTMTSTATMCRIRCCNMETKSKNIQSDR